MHSSSFLVSFSLLALLFCNVLAAIPSTLYRGDTREWSKVKDAGGFKSKGDQGDVFQHIEKRPHKDKFISTSSDITAAQNIRSKVYVYTLDSSKITKPIHDVAAEYAQAHKTYPFPKEKEFAVEEFIPWGAVTLVQESKNGKLSDVKDVKYSKRGLEFAA